MRYVLAKGRPENRRAFASRFALRIKIGRLNWADHNRSTRESDSAMALLGEAMAYAFGGSPFPSIPFSSVFIIERSSPTSAMSEPIASVCFAMASACCICTA